jgi:hypothetical protein
MTVALVFLALSTRVGIASPQAPGGIVHRRDRAYLKGKAAGAGPAWFGLWPAWFGLLAWLDFGAPMSETASAATPVISRPLLIIAAAAGILLAGTVALWAHYGTAVFYEMIVAGIATCL